MIKWIKTDQSTLLNTDHIMEISVTKSDNTYVITARLVGGRVVSLSHFETQIEAEEQVDEWLAT